MKLGSTASAPSAETGHLDAHSRFLLMTRALYAENVRWSAPQRDIACEGRENVIRRLLREASGMHSPEISQLRRSRNDRQLIDEYVILFTYTGEGIENAPIAAGDLVELKRLRILDLEAGKVVNEVCIETWSVLLREGAAAGPGPMAPRGDDGSAHRPQNKSPSANPVQVRKT